MTVYLIDGYNLLFKNPHVEGTLHEQRTQFIHDLKTVARFLHLSLIIVFDAHQTKEELKRYQSSGIEIVFTEKSKTADDYIIRYIDLLSPAQKEQLIVVSSDNYVQRAARVEGVKTLTVEQFVHMLARQFRTQKKRRKQNTSMKETSCSSLSVEAWLALFEDSTRKESKR